MIQIIYNYNLNKIRIHIKFVKPLHLGIQRGAQLGLGATDKYESYFRYQVN